MEHSIPVNIPSDFGKSNFESKSLCIRARRQSSIVISGSFFGASSINHPRNSGVSIQVNDPGMERKLNRTRKMSESIRATSLAQSAMARQMATIPTQKEDITLQWVVMIMNQTLLKRGLVPLDPDATDEIVYEVIDCKSSVGEFSSTYAMRVTAPKQLGEPYGFVIKMIPENDPCRAYVFETGLFEKENEVYFDLMPAIKFHCKSTFIEELIPECVYGSHNMDGAGVLVFKCCEEKGFYNPIDPLGLKVEKVRAVMTSIAEFHASARAFVIKHGVQGVQRRYTGLCQDMYSNGMLIKEISDCIESFDLLLNCALSTSPQALIEEDLHEVQVQFSKLKGCDSYLLLNNLRRQSKTGKLTTIIHGELWDRNLMLNDVTHQVKILDWKNAKLASATLDLAFLMLSSTSFDVRDDATNDLLKSYHQVYCQTLNKFAIPTEDHPSFKELLEDYQISLQVAVLQALCMFVQEMHYMTQNIAKAIEQDNTETVEDLSEKLKLYEIRALTLFKDLDLSQIEDDLADCNKLAGGSLSPSSPSFDEF